MDLKKLNRPIYLAKGIVLSYIITIILILIFSLLLTFTSIKESRITLLNTVVMISSVTAGSIYMSRRTKEQGWINGGLIGLAYYLILIILGFLFLKPMVIDIFSLSKFLMAVITGVIGGMIGINI